MKKGPVWILIVSIVVLSLGIGTTLAYLIASSNRVENAFTIGNVDISLTETTGTTYRMSPGVTLMKDPSVTVHKGSDGCWLFIQVEEPDGFDLFCTFEMQNDWMLLSEAEGVYYQKIDRSDKDRTFKILKNDRVYVKDTVTEEQLNAVPEGFMLKFTAGAVQSDGIATAQEAWRILNS